ncbi:MAG: HAD-IC family P-type ATPase, partial [Clostridia bacterium]|nr:HAD-IC family P-type ATPase [Clostridia bacterium]
FRDASSLAPGMVIEVFSGETVPADGVVVTGGGTLDYSGWLLHHKTVSLQEGVRVYCGAVNYGRPISVRVTAAGQFTLAQKMRRAAQDALQNKSTVQTVLRKLTMPFGALMLLIALITGVFVPLFGGAAWNVSLYRAAQVIALAGMGEIVVSVSMAFAAGINALCRRGVLFKSCRQVMLLSRITDLIFSKTGTLTERNFLVYEVVPHNEYTKEELLYYAAAAEQVSDHLIAHAIMKKAGDIALPTPEHVLEIPGEGVCVAVEGKRVFVGNDMLMNRAGIQVLPYHGNGMVCFVAVEDTYIGCIILNDPIKPGSSDAIDGLFRLKIRSIDLVTGDKRKNGESVGLALGLHRIFAELSAKEKAAVVARNARKGKYGGRIAFVGDESDAACMEAADISFAIKNVEDDLQGTAADIAVLSDHPEGVLDSFVLSARIRKMVFIMLCLSGFCKVLLLILSLCMVFPYWCVVLVEVLLGIVGSLLACRCRKNK